MKFTLPISPGYLGTKRHEVTRQEHSPSTLIRSPKDMGSKERK